MNEIGCTRISDKIRELEITLTCSECNEIFKDPVIIGRCGHTFCRKCILGQTDNHCPTCKVPIENKDAQDDKQLRDLILLVQELKLTLTAAAENQPSNVQLSTSDVETPNNRLSNRSEASSFSSLSKSRQARKRNKGKEKGSGAGNTSVVSLTPVKSLKSASKTTPVTSPIASKYKRSPFRYSAFSASKRGLNKSPGACGSPLPSNLEKRNCKGETLLHVAVVKGDIQKVTMLLEKNANPNVKDNAGWTPLHEASQKGFLDISRLLVKHGATVNVFGPDNITPLHDALISGNIEVAIFLAKSKADLHAKTSQDVTALDLCQDEELKEKLLEANAVSDKVATKIKSPPKDVKMQLMFTSLSDLDINDLQICAKTILNANVYDDFTMSVSHIVTTLDKHGKCRRTVKILQGILSGKWVIGSDWIKACMKQKKIISEEAYEAKGAMQVTVTGGPTRARQNVNKQRPPLFYGCFFYLHGPFDSRCPSKEVISQLIQLGGGKVLAREPKAETVKLEKFFAPYHAVGGATSQFNHFILSQDQPAKELGVGTDHICAVNFQWLVNSICSFTLLDLCE